MSGLGEEAAPDIQGGIGVDPTEACEEVGLPGQGRLVNSHRPLHYRCYHIFIPEDMAGMAPLCGKN